MCSGSFFGTLFISSQYCLYLKGHSALFNVKIRTAKGVTLNEYFC